MDERLKKIAEYLDNEGIENYVPEELQEKLSETTSVLSVPYGFDNCHFWINLFTSTEGKNIKFTTSDFARYPQDKIGKAFEVINSINREHPLLKFCVDPEDGGVNAEYDLTVDLELDKIGNAAFEIILLFFLIIKDDAFPAIMKSIWS